MIKSKSLIFLLSIGFILFINPLVVSAIETEFSVEVTLQTEEALSAVRIDGTHGINELAGRITGTNGLWSFDIRDLDESIRDNTPTLFFSKSGYKFEPAHIEANIENCPEYTCQVKAIPSENESSLVKIIFDMNNIESNYFNLRLTGASNSELVNTYFSNFALFSVPKKTESCNDFDSDPENNSYNLVVSRVEANGYECSFTNLPKSICPDKMYTNIVVNGSCSQITEVAPDNNYKFIAKDERGNPIDRLGLMVFPEDPEKEVFSTQTDRDGISLIDTNLTGYSYKVIPYGFFNFTEEIYEINLNNCYNRVCRIYGNSTLNAQDIANILLTDTQDNPISGISFSLENNYSSINENKIATDKNGRIYFPIKRQTSCSNDLYRTKITPSSPNCVFNHVSETPFSYCNTAQPEEINIKADCSQEVENFKVKGRVYTSNGLPYPRVPILVNEQMLATSRDDGSFNLNLEKDSTFLIKPNIENIIFDPSIIEISKINDNQELTFRVAAGNGFIPEDPNYRDCEPKDNYTISGTVFDLQGNPTANINIYNNHSAITTTNEEGKFSIEVTAQSDNWITAELNDEEFDPAGISFPFISCDEGEVNFQLSNYTNHLLSGRATLANGDPISELKLNLTIDGESEEILTDSEGYYRKSTKEGVAYSISISDVRYVCTPNLYNGTALNDYTNLNFICEFDECLNDDDKTTAGICGCGVSELDSDFDSVPDCIDECSNDVNKIEAGICGCGTSEIDNDFDGTPDCIDECPVDINKSKAGICGCGIEENLEDSDFDSTPDCIDLCPNDPDKIISGNCGCGTSDIDTDGDAISDCQDLCPNDPNKIATGICGCGVGDFDSDEDGTLDCNDLCPNDRLKISEGICGCNVRDIDTDLDGTLDCEESCPLDPNKTLAGECGCGVLDIDSDGDDTLDCFDQCPFDSNKLLPGICGCNVSDIDSDSDGVADCIDLCPSDINKIAPNQCGCGELETDTDNDGVADCLDLCPQDPNKVEAGICGCGTLDTDNDSDGIPNCNDNCEDDPLKTEPLQCGCGVADNDSDFDGTLDCNELCPSDPLKLKPLVCGCGIPDTDIDNDGVLDCKDGCPNDTDKIVEGICGCGVSDRDSDSDGIVDCQDQCPEDNNKSEAGQCGCGVLDTDSDSDGIADCLDLCPNDSNKSESGVCGCGISDIDTDRDGTPDCQDLCPSDPDKIKPGACGCNAKDSDSDGTLDCQDQCVNDANKITPGICGCGVSDVDTDGDGVSDCKDECDTNPLKLTAGVCGCDLPDVNTDGDSKLDCEDACPFDVNKLTPGICGCGISDADTDSDGLSDCQDLCPSDPLKTSPLSCGCGNLETDSDGDGFPDCIDSCPNDSRKQNEGACGCGIKDTDTDGDGIADCRDECLFDPIKAVPGICGCNESDFDKDNDGTSDCIDECPNDPNKTEYGICGCGNPDVDRNNNGLTDCKELELELTPLCIDNSIDEPEEIEQSELCETGATELINYNPGKGSYENEVPDLDRQYATKALGVPEFNDTMNFVSLGRGGFVEIGFNGKILKNKEGADFKVIETSWRQRGKACDSYPEYAEAYVTKDRVRWYQTSFLCRDGEIDFGLTGLDGITAIRIQDVTQIEKSDGYDVDGIGCVINNENPPVDEEPSPDPTDSPDDDDDDDDEWECDNGLGKSNKCDDDRSDDDDDSCKNGKGECNDKILICHIPPGNPSKKKTLEISENAKEAHLNHGDYLGECVNDNHFVHIKNENHIGHTDSLSANKIGTQEVERVKWKVKNFNPSSHELSFKHVSENPELDKYFEIEANSEFVFSTPRTPSLESDGHTIKMFVDEVEQAIVTHPLRACDWTPPITHSIRVEVLDENNNPLDRRVIIGNPDSGSPEIHYEKQSGGDGVALFENLSDKLKYTVYVDKGCEYDISPKLFLNTLEEDAVHTFRVNRVRDLAPNSVCGTIFYRGLPLKEVKVSPEGLEEKLSNEDGNFWYENIENNFLFTYSSEKAGYTFSNEPNSILIDGNKTIRYNAIRDFSIENPDNFVWAGGAIKNRRGRKIKVDSKFYRRLIATNPILNIKRRGLSKTRNVNIPFSWIEQVEIGKRYTLRILKNGGYRVVSKPNRYRRKFRLGKNILGLHFALSVRSTRFFRQRMIRSRQMRNQ